MINETKLIEKKEKKTNTLKRTLNKKESKRNKKPQKRTNQ